MEENSSYGSDNGMDNNSGDSLSPHQENNNNSIGNNNNNSSFEDNNSSSIGAVSQLFPVSGVGSGIGSRSIAEYSSENESCSQASPSSYNEDDSSMFRGGSNGASTTTMTKNGPNGTKVKVHKCRNCGFTTTNKHESWLLIAIHMKPEKILRCPDCPFVTEYKHHLDFHVWNHQGMKPYKCDQCPYVCVNKSMLKSHLKSHSNVYQYRCANCAYRTKYCHSLKIHLRKYRHEPGVVLDSDGRPNPNPVIDVYGNRRGPKQRSKKHGSVSPSGSSSTTASSSFILSQVVPSAAAAAAAAAAVPSPTAPGVGQLNSPYHQSFPWMQSIFFRSDDNSAPGTTSLTPPIPAAALISQILPATNACNLDNSKLDDFCLKQLDANNKHNNNNNNFNYRNINNNDNNQLNLHSCLAESVKELPVPRYPSPKQSNPTVEVPMIYDRLTPNNDFAEGANAIESVSPLLDCVPLNLSLTTGSGPLMTTSDPSASSGTSLVTGDSGSSTKMKNRRKGIACKLKRNYLTAARSSDDEEVSDSLFRQSSSKSPEELSRISDSVEQQQQQQQQQQKQQQEQQHLDYYHRAVGTARRLSTAGRSDSAVTNRATTDDSEEESSTSPVLSNFDKSMIDNSGAAKSYLKQQSSASLKSEEENKSCFYCKHCEITFFNQVMFTMHMGYHGFADPFTCNRCGKKTDNNIGFYAHMITAPHS